MWKYLVIYNMFVLQDIPTFPVAASFYRTLRWYINDHLFVWVADCACMRKRVTEWVSLWMSEWMSDLVNELVNELVSELGSELVKELVNEWVSDLVNEGVSELVNEWLWMSSIKHFYCFCCYRYHTGSLAFGSLIIAIVQLIRASLEYLDHKLNGTVLMIIY